MALRTIAPQDLAAIDAWIDVHGTEEERQLLKQSLPSLPIGDAWVWSPGWPTADGIFEHVHVLPIGTFDSGATPKPGEKRVEPKNLADVDLDALSRQMSATIEKAKAEMKEYKGFVDGLEKDGLINKKEGYTIQHRNGELIINGKKQPADVYNKYRTFLKKHEKFTIKKSDDDFNIYNDDDD